MHVREFLIHRPSYQGLIDASKYGIEGVWYSGKKQSTPFVWYLEWPQSIRDEMCSLTSPNGSLSISVLELMGIFVYCMALEQAVDDPKHTSVTIWCDNISALSWIYKFQTSTFLIASSILQALATHMHVCHSGLLTIDHI